MPATGLLDRHAGVHQRQRRAADRGHRRRAVGLEDVRHDADRVREVLGARDDRHERPLGERAVADVAALGAAHEAGLAHREGREVVVVPVELLGLEPERVEAHLLLQRAERGDAERLRLAAREERRAVRARQRRRPRSRSSRISRSRAAVGALLVDGDALADDRLLELVERELRALAVLGVGVGVGVAGVLLERRPPRRPWSRPGARACPRPAWPRRARRRGCRAIWRERAPRRSAAASTCELLLAGLLGQLALQRRRAS